jgi:hypothetical protein
MPNTEDFALVVGINDYRSLDALDGAKNDANAFLGWLRSPVGGDVPEENVGVFLSSPEPWAPGLEELVDWMIDLVARRSPGLDQRIGRRLYLFMAGHGIGPDVDEAGLLVPTTSAVAVKYLAGSRYANFFRAAALFDEVLLFMDCCRDHDWELPDAYFPFRARPDPAAAHRVKILYAFATGFGRKSRERVFDEADGSVGGVFTRALLDGLACKAAAPDGRITAESLKRYVVRQVEALRLPGTDQRPDVRVIDDFVLRQGCPPPRVTVVVELSRPDLGFTVQDAGNRMALVDIAPRQLDGGQIAVDLVPGRIYVFRVMEGGQQVAEDSLEVTEVGDHHVRL